MNVQYMTKIEHSILLMTKLLEYVNLNTPKITLLKTMNTI